MIVAALFVATDGCYFHLDDVIPWDITKDARKYPGPHRVVCHPPCERWGRYWSGGPMLAGTPKAKKKGDDDGCFESALASLLKWGGVLEHPEASHAWSHFGLTRPPHTGGWTPVDHMGLRACCVEQGHYGHVARKKTWLLTTNPEPPELLWGPATGIRLDEGFHSKAERDSARAAGVRPRPRLSTTQNIATPIPFRDLLLSIARC